MKRILLLLLLSVTFLGCKKDEGASSGSSREVKYEWTSETSAKVSIGYTENATSPIVEEYIGKSWKKSFVMDASQGFLNIQVTALDVLATPGLVIKGKVTIYVGGVAVKSQDVTFNQQNFFVILSSLKPN